MHGWHIYHRSSVLVVLLLPRRHRKREQFPAVFFLCVERNAITPKQTIIKAESVPILTISASSPRETNHAIVDMIIPVVSITFTGVFVFLFTPLKYSGSKPSRLIEKMTLVNA